ncbi:MAG TPA: TIM barrel protein [Acidobacteriaceae bacterium]|jgi:inosose dehydratase
MKRREFLFLLAGTLAHAAQQMPANRNVRWALGSNLWNSYPGTRFTDMLDVMHDTGFIGLRLTQYPQILTKYDITPDQMERELSRRGLHVITISFNGAADDAAQHGQILARAREAMTFLQRFGADRLVVFSPPRGKSAEAFAIMCRFYNQLGEAAGEMGFKAGLHNHLGQMVQTPEEIDRCMELTDPKLFYFSPDTAHVYLGGGDPAAILEKYKHRLMMADYKDAKRAGLTAKYITNTFDLGDGEIDFPACHRVLRSMRFKGWLCVDLDIARNGPRASYDRCGAYIKRTLEPIYA